MQLGQNENQYLIYTQLRIEESPCWLHLSVNLIICHKEFTQMHFAPPRIQAFSKQKTFIGKQKQLGD